MSGYSKYPNSIDDSTTLPLSSDNVTPVKAEVVNRLRSSILSIEAELGINPSGSFGTVRDRLDSIIAGSGSGTGAISVQLNSSVVNSNTLTVNFAGDVTASIQSPTRVLVTVGGNTTQVQETIVVTNGQASITLTNIPVQSNNVEMFVNGIKQNYGADYTVIGRTVSYFSAVALISTDIVEFVYYKTNLSLTPAPVLTGQTFDITGIKVNNYVTTYNELIRCNPTSTAFSVTLPTAISNSGRCIIIKNVSNSVNTITVGAGSETIDGSSSYVMAIGYQSIMVVSDGSNWIIV